MKFSRSCSFVLAALSLVVYLPACKTKKALPDKSAQTSEVVQPVPVKEEKPQTNSTTTTSAVTQSDQQATPVAEKLNYTFANIQFEFNSAVLKTPSYPIMDKAALLMKADPSVKFILKGYSSAEGTPQHNQSLSEERANSVKTYLTNAGVDGAQLSTKGYGESNPVASNATEDGKVLNRRVEIRKN